jgi:GPH family glycoside/pentoside/hexuronide:cation symporter
VSESTEQRLSIREKFAYGLGDTACNLTFQTVNLFLFIYYTDVFGLPAAAVGTMVLVARVLDAVLDPLTGIIADRTQSRWGKFRPFILFGAIPFGFCGYLMFSNPSLSQPAKLVFAYVTYIMMWVAYTVVNIPYSALMGVMSSSSADRTSLSTYRFACAFSGGLAINALTLPLRDYFGHGDAGTGYKYTMALFSIISVAMLLYTFSQTKERVVPKADPGASLGKDLKYLFANGPWLVLFFAAFLTLTNVGVRNAAIIYYFKYNVGDESKFTLFGTLGTIAFIAGAMATPLFLRFSNRRSLMIVLTSVNAVFMAAFFFVDPKSIVTLHILNIIGTFAVGPTPAIVWSMYADTADYGAWKFGRRTTGLVFSAAVFAQKIGLAVGSFMLGWALTFVGFVPNAIQTPRSLLGIKVVFSLLPGIIGLLSGLAIFFYKLDEPTVKQMERELADRAAAEPLPA